MPYIKQDRRADIDPLLTTLLEAVLHLNEGEMNYVLTRLVKQHVTHGGEVQLRYADIQEAIGLLECVKQEFYRRIAGPHEDQMAEVNGDVFTV